MLVPPSERRHIVLYSRLCIDEREKKKEIKEREIEEKKKICKEEKRKVRKEKQWTVYVATDMYVLLW